MAEFDPTRYRNIKDGIGSPGDDAATNSTGNWTLVALIKGLINTLTVTGTTLSPAFTDDAAFTPGTTKVMPAAGTYRSTRDSLDDGDAGAVALTAKRGLYVSPESPLGDSLVDDTNDRLNVGVIAAQNGVDGGIGAATAKTVRTTTATDSSEIVLLAAVLAAINVVNTSVAGVDSSVDAVNVTVATTLNNTLAQTLDEHLDDVEPLLAQVVANTEMLETLLTPMSQGHKSSSSAAVSSLAATSTSKMLLGANMARRSLSLFNADSNAVLVKFGEVASSTSFTVRIGQNGYYEMPRPTYTGRIDVIWEGVGSGSLMATEF